MSEAVRFPARLQAVGYSASDCALQEVLFGLSLKDETPEGPTRTWIYQEGSADDAGCFEPISANRLPRPDVAIPLIRVEAPDAAKLFRPAW